jgi:hypothetical protein
MHLEELFSLVLNFCDLQIAEGPACSPPLFCLLYFPCRSVSSLKKLIAKGVLPQEAKPPESILLKPPLDYLDWISHLPKYLQHKVIHLSPSCSIMEQKEKVCLWGQKGDLMDHLCLLRGR